MPAAYDNLAPFLRPGHPEENSTDSAIGNTYLYRTDTATIAANKPTAGATWADGRPVVAARAFELSGVSGVSELMVVTSVAVALSGDLGTPTLEKTVYALIWRPILKPLEVHPDFQTGGAYELDATAWKCILGWRQEQDPSLRSQFKFRQLDSHGTPGTEVDIATESPNAKTFLELSLKGVEEYTDYMPVWRKRGIYRGNTPPSTGVIGQADPPSGPIPSAITDDYFFLKSKDDAESYGTSSKWRRDEEWEGAVAIYADRDDVFPDGEPY